MVKLYGNKAITRDIVLPVPFLGLWHRFQVFWMLKIGRTYSMSRIPICGMEGKASVSSVSLQRCKSTFLVSVPACFGRWAWARYVTALRFLNHFDWKRWSDAFSVFLHCPSTGMARNTTDRVWKILLSTLSIYKSFIFIVYYSIFLRGNNNNNNKKGQHCAKV